MRIKSKYVGLLLGVVFFSDAANAVVLSTALIANSSNNVGLITTDINGLVRPVTGRAFIYSTSVELSAADVGSVYHRVAFEALILNDPGMVRANIAFTNGAVTSAGSVELGAAGNKIYVWMQSDESAFVSGLFQGPDVPALGAVTLNSGTMKEDLIGTSTYRANGTSGFQLGVPEPSTTLLCAIGALGSLRRRRI